MITIVGGGLAGTEAAYQIAKRKIKIKLFEQRPVNFTPVHKTSYLAELVCSNSLGSYIPLKASGFIKRELSLLGSFLIKAAFATRIPAGHSLTVDRERFSKKVTEELEKNEFVEIIREEVKEIPEGVVIIATGPLTSDDFAERIKDLVGEDYLYFYDATSPIVTAESINWEKVYLKARYNKGEAYVNCPMTKEEYERFVEELLKAETHPLKEFEKKDKGFFEACLPIEEIARRGKDALRFGPLRPIGLEYKGKLPYAVVQLRPENKERTLYNLVGFQTNLRFSEQNRIFRMIPGLEQAEFVRYGVMHRNTFINSPQVLLSTLQFKKDKRIFFAGQITGAEGYVSAIATGFVAGINAVRFLKEKEPIVFPSETMIGALLKYITTQNPDFQPMKANFGLLPPIPKKLSKKKRYLEYLKRAVGEIKDIQNFIY